jgi:hypothetical protein
MLPVLFIIGFVVVKNRTREAGENCTISAFSRKAILNCVTQLSCRLLSKKLAERNYYYYYLIFIFIFIYLFIYFLLCVDLKLGLY